jgi:hypothetical protein
MITAKPQRQYAKRKKKNLKNQIDFRDRQKISLKTTKLASKHTKKDCDHHQGTYSY